VIVFTEIEKQIESQVYSTYLAATIYKNIRKIEYQSRYWNTIQWGKEKQDARETGKTTCI